ncbi:MAG: AAA ATPase [Caeruleum heppii]|nr:MAG: AAA ATPase [Caeruleum heppii]
MAPTVLGKRSRAIDESPEKTRFGGSVKRRTRSGEVNDENENPFVTRNAKTPKTSLKTAQHGDPMQLDVLETPTKVNAALLSARSKKRVALSPSKINGHFKTTKPGQDENVHLDAKLEQTLVPQTPRHRDAQSKKLPVTPRHRVSFIGKPLTPRTPKTPGTPSTPSNPIPTVYNSARQMFVRSANPGRLVGRDEERLELRNFLDARIDSLSGGCMYVSGPPGTGKSALVQEVCADYDQPESVRRTYINCMSMKTSADVYGKLVEDFAGDTETRPTDHPKVLQQLFVPPRGGKEVYVVTLDEVDHLLTLDLELLYELFEASLHRSSRLILIGIANALDLTDRFLPRLKARNLKPELLPFLPYTAPQITSVITTRLRSLLSEEKKSCTDYVPFLHPTAIQLCSRKVASQTGDLRKAFDLCRRAIDVIESEIKAKHQQQIAEQVLNQSPSRAPLVDNINLSSPPASQSPKSPPRASKCMTLAASMATLTAETAPRATVAHVARISSATFGNGVSQRLQTLNLQQKAALCALMALEKKRRQAAEKISVLATPSKHDRVAPTVRMLFESYTVLCRRDGVLHPLTSTEFGDVVSSLETLSLISPVDGRTGSFVGMMTPSKRGRVAALGGGSGDERRVASCVGEKELETAVEGLGAGILKSILRGEDVD